jgi:hypothetical protein
MSQQNDEADAKLLRFFVQEMSENRGQVELAFRVCKTANEYRNAIYILFHLKRCTQNNR